MKAISKPPEKTYQCARCLGSNLVFDPKPDAPNFEWRANCEDCEDDVPVIVVTSKP